MTGIQVQFDDVKNGLGNTQAKQKMIPSYNDKHPDDHINVVTPNECLGKVTVWFDTSFATVATDTSSLHKIVEAARGLLPGFIDSPPNVTTVINGIDMGSVALGKVLDRVTASGDQQLSFKVTPCGESPHYISVTLTVSGFEQISDKGDDDESVRLTMTLQAGGASATKSRTWNGKDSDGGPDQVLEEVQVALKEDNPFTVHVSLLEFCVTDGRVGWGATVSMIRIDQIQIVIQVVSEAEYDLIRHPPIKEPGSIPGGSESGPVKSSGG